MLTCFSPYREKYFIEKWIQKSGEAGWPVDWWCGYAGLLLALLLSDSWQHMLTPASILGPLRTPHLITHTPCISSSFITPSIYTTGPLHHSHMHTAFTLTRPTSPEHIHTHMNPHWYICLICKCRFKHWTSILMIWGNSSNHCTTTLPIKGQLSTSGPLLRFRLDYRCCNYWGCCVTRLNFQVYSKYSTSKKSWIFHPNETSLPPDSQGSPQHASSKQTRERGGPDECTPTLSVVSAFFFFFACVSSGIATLSK